MSNKKARELTVEDKQRARVYLTEFAKLLPVFSQLFGKYYNNKNRNRDSKYKEDVLGLLNKVRTVVESDMGVTSAGKSGNVVRVPINNKYEIKVFVTYDRLENNNILNSMGVKGINVYDKSKGKVYKLMTVVNESGNVNFKLEADDFKVIQGQKRLESLAV